MKFLYSEYFRKQMFYWECDCILLFLIQRTSRIAPHLCRIVSLKAQWVTWSCISINTHWCFIWLILWSKRNNSFKTQTSYIWHRFPSPPIHQTFQHPHQVLGMVPLWTSFQRLSEGYLSSWDQKVLGKEALWRSRAETCMKSQYPVQGPHTLAGSVIL